MGGKSDKRPHQPARVRLFVALDLPEEARVALAAWAAQAAQRAGGALRAVPAENLHLTLAFLGAREETQAPAIGTLVTATTGVAPQLSLTEALWLPPRRPGVLSVELHDHTGALASLHSSLIDALAREAAFTPEARPFRPHVTVARVRRHERVHPNHLELPPPPRMSFAATPLTLYRSRTAPGGARYEPLARRALL